MLCETYLWVKLVDATDCVVNVTPLNSSTNNHAIQDTVRVDKRLETALPAEAIGCILVAFNDKVVHYESIKITVENASSGGKKSQHDCHRFVDDSAFCFDNTASKASTRHAWLLQIAIGLMYQLA